VHDAEGACPAGIIDDIYGADFVNGGKDGNIQDQNGHGTFVAGVVGAVTNNALGVVGINQVRFQPAQGPQKLDTHPRLGG